MNDKDSSMDKEIERIEKKIKEKIDAIFANEISDYRFVRSSSEKDQGDFGTEGSNELVGQLQSFYSSLTRERRELKTLLGRLPDQADLQGIDPEEMHLQIMEMTEAIKQVGKNVGPVLDRLLRLTHQVLKSGPDR
jgi:hypothetical protein